MTTTQNHEIVGVRAAFWARDTKSERTSIIISAGRAGDIRHATDLARFLSVSGNDDGAVDFWPEVGGGTMVRNTATGQIVARYAGGNAAKADWPPFDDLPAATAGDTGGS